MSHSLSDMVLINKIKKIVFFIIPLHLTVLDKEKRYPIQKTPVGISFQAKTIL